MKHGVNSLRAVGICILIAGMAQYAVCRTHPNDFNEGTLRFLNVGWLVGSIVLAWLEPRLFFTYLGTVALSVPAISYSMLDYGALEMGGCIHAFSAGLLSVPFHLFFCWVRNRSEKPNLNAPEIAR